MHHHVRSVLCSNLQNFALGMSSTLFRRRFYESLMSIFHIFMGPDDKFATNVICIFDRWALIITKRRKSPHPIYDVGVFL
jgi:hypothetical protein